MVQAGEVGSGRRTRRWRSVSEKLQVVQQTFEPGAKVAEVARAYGLNANQVFTWRRAFQRGELAEHCGALLPVNISNPSESEVRAAEPAPRDVSASGGSIHIEFPGRALISVESGADLILLRSILESPRNSKRRSRIWTTLPPQRKRFKPCCP